jgi:hypothetical protein
LYRPQAAILLPSTTWETGAGNVYKLDKASGAWNKFVPKTLPGSNVSAALRWFVNPYEPNTLYVLDSAGVKVSTDGGASWHLDFWLTYNVTAAGKLQITSSLLQDMIFMRGEEWTRFAFGTAGVFWTADFGVQWYTILNSFAMPGRPESGFFDPISDLHNRVLYVECEGRSLVKISGIPEGPPFEPPTPIDMMTFAAIDG